MEIGIQLIQGFILGVRTFNPTDKIPYNEAQIFLGPICIYITWD